ncbi:TIGR04013 family B12-binding domain/radical SAM domain-containing protein [Candidatus Poribacteria bacterium]|nr:TIGR04013 family B12-binding domain/radical SAM domain-containing protein [Candidatus Poribacteria bacterium]
MELTGRVIWRYSEANHNALCALGSSCEGSAKFMSSERADPSPGDVICYSFRTSELEIIREEVRAMREAYGDKIVLIAGGPHPSGDPYGALKLGFDKVFTGPCEEEMASFLRREIPDDEEIITGRSFDISKYPISSDHLPLPRGIEISRGCPYGCRFCQVSYVFGFKVYHRSPESVIEFVSRRGMKIVRFVAPNSLAYMAEKRGEPNLNAIEKLLVGLRRAGARQIFFGTFPSEIRPDWVKPEAMRLIKELCDNRTVVIGAQSGSDRMLKLMGRGHSVEDVRRAVEITKQAGLEPRIDLIFFAPDENEEDRQATFEFAEEMGRMGVVTYAHIFMPLPGTPWANRLPQIDSKSLKRIESLVGRGIVKGNWRRHLQILGIK